MFKSLSIFLLLSTSHLAYSQEEVIHAQVQAMGQAGSVNPGDNSTITLNPAAISLNERYDYQAHFSISEGPDYSFASSVVDTKTAPFAMGMAYQRVNYDPILQTRELPGWIITGEEFNKRKRYDNISLAIAYPFADRRFSIGASGTVAIYNHDIQGKGVTGNMDVGIVGRPVQAWSIGVSGRNLIPTYNCRTDTERSQPCIPDLDPGLLIGNYYVV